MRNNASAALDAVRGLCPTKLPGAASKADTDDSSLVSLAVKAVDADEGILICVVSKAGVRDREREMIPLHALKAATYQLVQDIGKGKVSVDINHGKDAVKCDVVMAWIGYPAPDENACLVALRPHDRSIVEAAKAGQCAGLSWSGPYRLKDAGS
jgi:hypothetical protein